MNVDDKTYQRFMSKVSKDQCGCWIWTGSIRTASRANNLVYGSICLNGKVKLAHRASWEIHNGTIPDGKIICHSCDNPKCVNPEHLWVGTQKDNIQDAWRKGRGKGNVLPGENHPNAKLTKLNVKEIRESDMIGIELAKKFNVSKATISMIKNNKLWREA